MTPAALYERQRALVRAGLIKAKPGRGRGTGVAATPHALAMLMISLVATGSLTETAKMTRVFANLKSVLGACPLTGKRTFGAALTAVLESSLIERVHSIESKHGWKEYSANIILRKRASPYFTREELTQIESAGENPDWDKLHAWEYSRFSAYHPGRGVLETTISLWLEWLKRLEMEK